MTTRVTNDDDPTCSRCHCDVDEDADCQLCHGRPVYLCGECLEALREAKADADRDDRLMEVKG